MATSIQLRDLNQLSKMTESYTGSRYECNSIDELILMLYFFLLRRLIFGLRKISTIQILNMVSVWHCGNGSNAIPLQLFTW